MAGGCIAVLDRMHLRESSGFLYDCYLYPQGALSAANLRERERYRREFRDASLAHPPAVLIVSSDECGPPDFAYTKLSRWPWLSGYLASNYSLALEHRPATLQRWGGKPVLPYGYRIYRRVTAVAPQQLLTGSKQERPAHGN